MPRDIILGTAGHIDHGKTALVRALTGTQLDRRPEERSRGITIDLGFAHFTLGEFHLGLIDVPGHERFVRNMLAGAAGVEVGLLVVAADDGVMPQTREHLAILDLLGVQVGVVALTKCDLVDDTTRDVAQLEIRELLASTTLREAAIVPVSAVTGEGLDALRAALEAACRGVPAATDWPARLPVDRAFTVAGHGSVVTGSIAAGELRAGDELDWHAGTGVIERVRVRGLANHGQPTEQLARGQRAAVNLAGVPVERLARGQELAAPGTLHPSRVLTVEIRCLPDAPRPLRHRLPVRFHTGTAEIMGTLALLDGDQVRPGERGFAQIFLTEWSTAIAADRFVVRSASAEETLGGGRVLHPSLGKLRRRHITALTHLEQLAVADPVARVAAVSYLAGHVGFDPSALPRVGAVPPRLVPDVVQSACATADVLKLGDGPRTKLTHRARLVGLETWILADLARRHAEQPLVTTHDRAAVYAALPEGIDRALLVAAVDRLAAAKLIVGDARRIARADFKPRLSLAQRKLRDKLAEDFRQAGVNPPDPQHYLPQAQNNPAILADVLEVACAEGLLVRITADFYLHTDIHAQILTTLRAKLANAPMGGTVAEIRDWLGTTRKYAVPLCEYLDRSGVTVRNGDVRKLAGH